MLDERASLSEELRRRGKRSGGLLMVSEWVRGSETVREQLKLADEDQALRLERLRTADGTPCAYEIAYLPYPRASGVYQRVKEVAEGSLYTLMSTEGLSPYVAEQTLKGGVASTREAELLQVPANDAGLRYTFTPYHFT